MKKPTSLIGSETEYGIMITAENGRTFGGTEDRGVGHEVIQHMLKHGLSITGGVKRNDDTLSTLEEHARAEELLRNLHGRDLGRSGRDMLLRRLLNAQRRGYTGSFLANGARFYEDMRHPEYSCPECSDPYSALVCQKAGDYIVEEAARRSEEFASVLIGSPSVIDIFKNNSDGQGNSYAGHENYFIDTTLFQKLRRESNESAATLLFFVTRQIVTGAGKHTGERASKAVYQISQRPDFFFQRFSEETTVKRGIINLRDAPYSRLNKSRFHVIVGDSNRSELSIFLKFGMSALFFMMLEEGYLERKRWPWWGAVLARPVKALKQVSCDLSLSTRLLMQGSPSCTALSVMRSLAECADGFVVEYDLPPVWRRVVDLWHGVLEGLAGNRAEHPLSKCLDWVLVERLLLSKSKQYGVAIDHDWCRAEEIDYRKLSADSVYSKLHARGRIYRVAKDDDIIKAVMTPPCDTRAHLRSEIIKRYADEIWQIRWDHISFTNGMDVFLDDPHRGGVAESQPLFVGDPTLDEFLERAKNYDPARVAVMPENISKGWSDDDEGQDPRD